MLPRFLVAGLGVTVAGALMFGLAPASEPVADAETVRHVQLSGADFLQPPRTAERAPVPDRASRGLSRAHIAHVQDVVAKRIERRVERARQARIAARKARIAREHAAAAARQRRQQVASVGGGAGYVGMAVAIARCESGGNPQAQNPSSSASGLYQFIDSTWASASGLAPPASAYSIATQTAVFWKVWNGGAGAGNWNPSRSCWG